MAEKRDEKLRLKVAEASSDDAYKGIVRIDSEYMKQIGIRPGDIVEISGERSTIAIVDRSLPADLGLSIIRMDGEMRRNAGTSLSENVFITKKDIKEARHVTIAPARKGIMIQAHPSTFKRSLLGRPLQKGDIISMGGTRSRRQTFSGSPFEDIFNMLEGDFMGGSLGFGDLKFVVVSTDPKEPVFVTENTEIEVLAQAVELKEEKPIPDVTYEDIGGLGDEISKVREMIELPLKHPEIFQRLGVSPPKGVLLYGPPGSGKTLIAKAVANESGANFLSIAGPEVVSKFYGEAEKNIKRLFEQAEKRAPSIIFIDEIDSLAPKREESYGEVERRMVAQLLSQMDGLKSRGRVIVIGATNRPDALDPALRRGGRFDREIEIGVPDKQGRLEILKIHTRNMPLKDVNLEELASITHGFVGADLEGLVKEAAMSALRKILPGLDLKKEERLPEEALKKLIVTRDDFKEALKMVRPSAMREVLIESPKVKWDDVGGLDEAKRALKEAIEWPLKNPEAFKRMGIKPARGVLLYGPPGVGKTLLVKAVATESEANFISIKGPELLSKFVGESEKGVREIFRRARQVSPCIVFFDEVDALAPRRGLELGTRVHENVVSTILTEMDGLEELSEVVVIAATNRPELVDTALLRPGRFDRHILIFPPDEKARIGILQIHTKGMPLTKDVDLKKLAKQLAGYSGADMESLCREAAMIALRKNMSAKEVKLSNFEEAIKVVRPSLTEKDTKKYTEAIKLAATGKNVDKDTYFG